MLIFSLPPFPFSLTSSLSLRSLGKKAKGAGAAKHAFRMDFVVVKYADEDEIEFEVVVLDAMGGRECFCEIKEVRREEGSGGGGWGWKEGVCV